MEEKEEELERKLRLYISLHCEELTFKFREQGGKVTKIKWDNFPFRLSKINENNYEFRGDAQIFMEAGNNGDKIVKPMKLHGKALIKENGDIEINSPIIIGI